MYKDEFCEKSWWAGYEAAKIEHETGQSCSSLGLHREDEHDDVDFRNGMTAYRADNELPDHTYDLPGSSYCLTRNEPLR